MEAPRLVLFVFLVSLATSAMGNDGDYVYGERKEFDKLIHSQHFYVYKADDRQSILVQFPPQGYDPIKGYITMIKLTNSGDPAELLDLVGGVDTPMVKFTLKSWPDKGIDYNLDVYGMVDN